MSEMMERVALAIGSKLYEHGHSPRPSDPADLGLRLARAAILALREPTEAIEDAGRRAMPPTEGYDLPDDCLNVWRAMIDAALAD